jgi:hypothetical protein
MDVEAQDEGILAKILVSLIIVIHSSLLLS